MRLIEASIVEEFLRTLTETEAGTNDWPEYQALLDALAVEEAEPDYERADAAFRIALATRGIEIESLPTAQVSRAIVDAALANYPLSTEGET